MPDLVVTCPNGTVLQFRDDVSERIRFGRDPQWADVVLDEAFAAQGVGREHCELVASAGCFSLEMNSQNRVWINGKDSFDGTQLPRECTLSFTPDSPLTTYRLQTRMTGGAQTVLLHGAAPVKGRRVNRLFALALFVCVSAVGFLWLNAFQRGFSDAAVATAESATFSVQTRLNDTLSHAGTAWLAAPNKVVTNRHVAQLVSASLAQARLGFKSDAFIRLRSVNNEEGETRRIVAVSYHPAEQLFQQYLLQHLTPFKNDFSLDLDVYDVALLQLEGPTLTMAPIPLAHSEQVSKMRTGDALMIIGYPLNKAGNAWDLLRPIAERKLGVFDKTRNVFSSEGASAWNPLLSYDVDTRGGNSGSPVLNEQGEAVAIHFAGDKLLLEGATINGQQTTTRIDGWKSYGQHIRLVKQLVDDTMLSAEKLQEEQEIWSHWLASVPSVKAAAVQQVEQQLPGSLYRCEASFSGVWSDKPKAGTTKRRFTQDIALPAYQYFYAYVQSFSVGGERIDVSGQFGETGSYTYNGNRHYTEFSSAEPSAATLLNLTLGGPDTQSEFRIALIVWSQTDCSGNHFMLQKASPNIVSGQG